MITATCKDKKVLVNNEEIQDAIILGDGIESSNGILLFDEELSPVYVPNTQPDLKDILDLMKQITSACSSITTNVMGAPTPINNAGDFSSIESQISQKQNKLR